MECVHYNNQLREYLFPWTELFQTYCISYDKTYLFITSLVRIAISLLILYLIYAIVKYMDKSLKYLILTASFYNIALVYLGINLLASVYIVLKQPKFPKEYTMLDDSPINDFEVQIVGDDGPAGRFAV